MDSDYKMTAEQITDIDLPSINISIPYSVSAYLDDSELINSSTIELSKKFNKSASFHDFTNIMTNPDKAIMLTNDTENISKDGYVEVEIKGIIHRIKVAK